MYISKDASRLRVKEAENARRNRAEIVRALSHGQITRRDLFKWGLFTSTGLLAAKNGLSPFAKSAYAQVPTGTPLTPLFSATKFSQPMPRLNLQEPIRMSAERWWNGQSISRWVGHAEQLPAKEMSWHNEFSNGQYIGGRARNPRFPQGPAEGRPPGEFFKHQKWGQYFPKKGYLLSLGPVPQNTIKFHEGMEFQDPNSVWSFGAGGLGTPGTLPPPLIKMRYGEPAIVRVYNSLPLDRTQNNGFGRNESSTHNHNAHNGFASDGACNAHIFPGQFYDYHWSTSLARADIINKSASDDKASGPLGQGGLTNVPGDWRELQSTLWFHDHRFFFTAENVYKGHLGMLNYYSGRDRGHERRNDGVNLRLPSGWLLPWGNIDFDVNLCISDFATTPDGQLFFDIFNMDGFVGDQMLVNFAWQPHMKVLPRKYRFRVLNACMSRFIRLVLFDEQGRRRVPFHVIANDGNFLVNPVRLSDFPVMGVAERFDVIVDFSGFRKDDVITMYNAMQHVDGRGPDQVLPLGTVMGRGSTIDPAVGSVMQFKVVDELQSVDDPSVTHTAASMRDRSQIPGTLTEQIPIVTPVRTRVIEWTKGVGDSNAGAGCMPDCGNKTEFPWIVSVNGAPAHSLNANRIANLIPEPGKVEHWTFVNGGSSWDHPIHLHFEEGITISRGGGALAPYEQFARKDVWRLGSKGQVTFQVQFSEFGGAYVNHCHNTVHEDFAMLTRVQVAYTDEGGTEHMVTPTPNPTPFGVTFTNPEILPEGDPRNGA